MTDRTIIDNILNPSIITQGKQFIKSKRRKQSVNYEVSID